MRKYSYGLNNVKRTASIIVIDGPWWSFYLEDFIMFICDKIPSWPLPNLTIKLNNKRDIKWNDGKDKTTIKEWYGDLNSLFHIKVCYPIFIFCEDKQDTRFIKCSYKEVKKAFINYDEKYFS